MEKHNCETCPKRKECFARLTPAQRKALNRFRWKTAYSEKLAKSQKYLRILVIPLMPIQFPFLMLLKVKAIEKISQNMVMLGKAIQQLDKIMKESESPSYGFISPERKDEQPKEKKDTSYVQ